MSRAATEGLDVEFRVGDAESLPAGDASFDAVLSVFGVMFAPDHQRAAAEIARVTRPAAARSKSAASSPSSADRPTSPITRHFT